MCLLKAVVKEVGCPLHIEMQVSCAVHLSAARYTNHVCSLSLL